MIIPISWVQPLPRTDLGPTLTMSLPNGGQELPPHFSDTLRSVDGHQLTPLAVVVEERGGLSKVYPKAFPRRLLGVVGALVELPATDIAPPIPSRW